MRANYCVHVVRHDSQFHKMDAMLCTHFFNGLPDSKPIFLLPHHLIPALRLPSQVIDSLINSMLIAIHIHLVHLLSAIKGAATPRADRIGMFEKKKNKSPSRARYSTT